MYWLVRALLISLLMALSPFLYATPCHQLEQLNWLLGDWQAQKDHKRYWENWQKVSEHSFEGQAGSTHNKEQSQEALRLVQMQGQIFYLAKVSENPLPIAFVLENCSASEAVFVNPAHDFPQRLHYQRQQNKLVVRVESMQGEGFTLHFLRE
ncbi:hypothetical protein KJY73_05095 [Bowmanella sp. Y26]|uniref:DUF6265 family protein n=1 Tax=Bowmanella yangjiangensis TaxID=2811230 RepID=UPI001BDD90C6|nr:DUF6265 family protein [Bowmanella yangjiangensis]MBT1062939.1 hypothetical protein [Bowmanella yangjiangensis]